MKKIVVFTFSLFFALAAYAQKPAHKHVLQVAGNLPLGNWAEDNGGGAGLGYGGQYQHHFVWAKGFGAYLGAAYYRNELSDDGKFAIDLANYLININTYPNYTNTPFSIGFSYVQPGRSKARFFASAGGVYNLSWLRDFEGSSGGNFYKVESNLNDGIGFDLDAGVILGNVFTLSLGYNWLGNQTGTQEYILNLETLGTTDFEQTMSFFTLGLGVMLGK